MIGLLFSSCNKDTIALSSSYYIIFGHFYGECVGEQCVEIFRLEIDKLFEDKKDQYPNFNTYYSGDYVQLTQDKFEQTKDLLNSFPIDLLYVPSKEFGYPDSGDQGGLYIEYNKDGVRKFWIFDQFQYNVPEKYHQFMVDVNKKISQIK